MIAPQKLEELQSQYPKGAAFRKGEVQIFVRKPTRGERIAFLDSATSKKPAMAVEKLVRAICIYPSTEDLDRGYEDDGFVLDEIGGEIIEWLRGGTEQVEIKKF